MAHFYRLGACDCIQITKWRQFRTSPQCSGKFKTTNTSSSEQSKLTYLWVIAGRCREKSYRVQRVHRPFRANLSPVSHLGLGNSNTSQRTTASETKDVSIFQRQTGRSWNSFTWVTIFSLRRQQNHWKGVYNPQQGKLEPTVVMRSE